MGLSGLVWSVFFEKGFSFENVTPTINDDYVDNISTIIAPSDTVPLTADVEPNFKRIVTTFAICAQRLTVILVEVAVFVIPRLCGRDEISCTVFPGADIIVFLHAGTWILKFLFDRYVPPSGHFSPVLELTSLIARHL